MWNKIISRMCVMFTLALFIVCNMPLQVFAENNAVAIAGDVYEFGEKDHYEFDATKGAAGTNADNTYGSFSITGDLVPDSSAEGIPSFLVNSGQVSMTYSYTDNLLNKDEEEWHLVEDKSKNVNGFKLNSNIRYGAVILQTSKDGEKWVDDVSLTNAFKEKSENQDPFYESKSTQLANGCYYRVIVAYKTGIKTGEKKVLVVNTDEYEYKKNAEVYQFYLHNSSAGRQSDNTLQLNLGTLTKTEKDKGYSGKKEIGIKDPHYGWELGQFFVSGYTRDTKDDKGKPVFLKNVGDQITLWFNLKQDINKLNGDDILSIADDKNGYDQYFQTPKTDMGRGTLIIRYTDEQGVKHEPEIYTNYLEASATTSADTIVRLFEEGDYEIALDYSIKKTPRKVKSIEVVPEYTDYRISFEYSVRNGNCMVFPFDVLTGAELSDGEITPNGFKLDMAKSRYLTIDVKRTVANKSAGGYVEDVRFNRPAKDGDEYTEEGIYTFNVKNLYTGEQTEKTIYVGESDVLKALSKNKMSVTELNAQLERGAEIGADGFLSTPTSGTR